MMCSAETINPLKYRSDVACRQVLENDEMTPAEVNPSDDLTMILSYH